MKYMLCLLLSLCAAQTSAQVTHFSPFMGTWENMQRATREIVKMEIFEQDGQAKMHLWFAASPTPYDAGIHDITVHTATAPRGTRAGPAILRWQGPVSSHTLEILVEQGSGGRLDLTMFRLAGRGAGTLERMQFQKYVPPRDCADYNPATLRINGNYIMAGSSSLMAFSDPRDRELAIAMARTYASLCSIGRDNPRPDRNAYIMEYWAGGGNGVGAPGHDCIGYDPSRLRVVNLGAEGYRVESVTTEGSLYLHKFHTHADAIAGQAVFRQHSFQCFIGRGSREMHQYLK